MTKQYKADEIRKIVSTAVDRQAYALFTVYQNPTFEAYGRTFKRPGKPLRCKGKIKTVFCKKKGLQIIFTNCFINKKLMPFDCGFWARDIRWKTLPANIEMLDGIFKKLPAGQNDGERFDVAENREK